jgi:hypothetical protein
MCKTGINEMKKGDKYKCIERGAYYEILCAGRETVTIRRIHDNQQFKFSLVEFNERFYKS